MLSDNTSYHFVQDIPGASITQSTVAVFGSHAITLSQLDQATSFEAMFDRYRILTLEITYRPHVNAVPPLLLSTTVLPQLVTVIDYDDNTAPTTFTTLREYQNSVVTLYETQQRKFTPGTLIGAKVEFSPWIDMASSNYLHQGVKWGIEAGIAGQTLFQQFSVNFRIHFECKNVRW